jgi:hypothetical protein
LVPDRIGETGWVKAPQVERFAGDSLFEYIDGAAEMYHKYDFVEVTVVKFLKGEYGITADLYLFESSDRAFGMYTTMRPDEPDTVSLGVEGFLFGPNLVFVKGSRLINVYTYDDFEEPVGAVRSVAEALDKNLPGTLEKPGMFALLPAQARLPFTEKIFAEGFLGHGFLTDVYTADYTAGDGQARLFITGDPEGTKLAQWGRVSDASVADLPGWIHDIFEEDRSIRVDDTYHGEILAGRRAGMLLGIVGYGPTYREIFVDWAGSLE